MTAILRLGMVVLGVVISSDVYGQHSSHPTPAKATAANVERALAAISGDATPCQFSLGDVALARGGHLQGIQFLRDAAGDRQIAFLSHDSQTVGYLVVVELPADLKSVGRVIHVHEFPSDGRSPHLRHAGGFQIAGDVLAIGLEDNQRKTRSEVQFWDVSAPTRPVQLKHLTIRRKGMPEDQTAGAVGILRREHDTLIAVGNWDCRAIDFYRTNGKPLADPGCRFEQQSRWQASSADKRDWRPDESFASYQNVNLIADAKSNVQLVGFATTRAGQDVVDLFSVNLDSPPNKILSKRANRSMKLAGGAHFVNGGGLGTIDGRPAILATPRNCTRETVISVSRGVVIAPSPGEAGGYSK